LNLRGIIFTLVCIFLGTKAQAVTTPASNIRVVGKTCTSIDITWSRGDGNLCLVTCRKKGHNPVKPSDGWFYFPDNRFGLGSDIGDSNFCIFSGIDTFISIRNLSENSTYIIQVFEFDYNPYTYLMADAPAREDSTYSFSATMEVEVLEPCKRRNSVRFAATSNANFLVSAYNWHFDSTDLYGNEVQARMAKSGSNSFTLNILPNMGCRDQVRKGSVYIIPGADSAIIHGDTAICTGENELFHSSIYFASVPRTGYTRTWLFENGLTANTLKLYRNHSVAGNHKLTLIVHSLREDVYTGCSDTFSRNYTVLAATEMSLGRDTCFSKGNLIVLTAPFPAAAYKWDELGRTRNYFVTDTGYHYLTIRDQHGCHTSDTIHIDYCAPTSSVYNIGQKPLQFLGFDGLLHWRNATPNDYPIQVIQPNGKLVAKLDAYLGSEGNYQLNSGVYFIRTGLGSVTKIYVP
jgi:hypothetical protein